MGDNAGPAFELSELVKQWNAKYAHPKLVIATTAEMMRAFHERHGDELPEFRGDFTPYWEDGAGSSSRETGLTRAAAERLVQAETLWSILQPGTYPDDEFYAAWRGAILYDEHTWGAYCSISQPESGFTRAQWRIKQGFALQADQASRQLLESAKALHATAAGTPAAVYVFNTNSWPRTDLVALSQTMSRAGDRVQGPDGQHVPSQRLSDGRLAFLATNVPPLGAKKYTVGTGRSTSTGEAAATGQAISNSTIKVTLDNASGAITELALRGAGTNFVDTATKLGMNDYFYVTGRDPKNRSRNGPAEITVKDRGPFVAAVSVESDAPGCRTLIREIRLVDGLDYVEITNVVDKENVYDQEAVSTSSFPA
jgi:hypothetical protein